jgi:hypothetical protein
MTTFSALRNYIDQNERIDFAEAIAQLKSESPIATKDRMLKLRMRNLSDESGGYDYESFADSAKDAIASHMLISCPNTSEHGCLITSGACFQIYDK